jgi:branched-subunit amino acid ABC-type transport system permease component
MKLVFTLTFILAVIVSAGIGCLVIFEIISFDQGKNYLLKTVAVIVLLGAASAVIALVSGSKNTPDE